MGTILFVDNNPLRASVRTSILANDATEVVRVLDAAEALCLVEGRDFAEKLSLVITEHIIPGISGSEFVAELRTRLSHVPVLVLGAGAAKADYDGISGVSHAEMNSPDELPSLASRLMAVKA